MKAKKKENIIIIAILVVMLIAIIGVSYAAFSFGQAGNVPNKITTGSITMTYTETDNTISLSNALPTRDATGTTRLKDGEYFDFNVSSEITGEVNINYEISAKEVGEGTIDGSNIKLYLTKLNGESEEQLMTPEVYSEETDSNEYTGRPSGEMSLYTSSMNASESNDYRLRMYVTEEYNPQGDGGGLTFAVQVNVYGKAGDKYVPLTTEEILEDNELQEEKTKMFNYASNGSYIASITEEGPQYGSEPSQVTNGLYSMEDEDGISYYFRGAVENNNVQFGEYKENYYYYRGSDYRFYQTEESCKEAGNYSCYYYQLASAGDKMYWKIVRVNGDGSLRLIYNGTSATPTPPSNTDPQGSNFIGSAAYNLDSSDPKYTGYTYDRDTNETDSFIKKEVDTWYKNALENTVYDKMIISGRFCSDSSGYQNGTDFGGGYVYASMIRLAQVSTNYTSDNTPTLKCPTTAESYGGSYRLKVGLLTADELILAGESYMVASDSYIKVSNTMTPGTFIDGAANVWADYNFIMGNILNDVNYIRPVINVKVDNGFTSGDGTAENPYVITAE